MQRKVTIGSVVVPHGLFLAPMAGVTDSSFRQVCIAHGAEYTVTEMISAKALWYHDKKTARLARISSSELPCAVQIFGCDPESMRYAAEALTDGSLTGCVPAAIDINMGCPMPKIAGNGDGAALMRDSVLAGQVIEAVKKGTHLPVTVKIRLGWDAEHINCVEIASVAASLGVSMIAVHGRTRAQMYAPPVDYGAVAAVRRAVPAEIPVLVNGDVFSAESALLALQQTGCDGVMVARGAEGNPWIFEEIRCALEGVPYSRPTIAERIACAAAHFQLLLTEKGDFTGVQEGRKHLAWYTRGLPGSAALRAALMQAETPKEVFRLLQTLSESGDNDSPAE